MVKKKVLKFLVQKNRKKKSQKKNKKKNKKKNHKKSQKNHKNPTSFFHRPVSNE
jgi:hypothetical protein